jgi:GxxExxY protein
MPYGETTSEEIERVAHEIVDAAFCMHSKLGAGLLESVYEECMAFELGRRGLTVERQVCVPIVYDGVQLEAAFRIDVLVNRCVLIELKAVEKMIPLYDAQVLTYLKLTGLRLGILMNFNSKLIKDGIKRIVL